MYETTRALLRVLAELHAEGLLETLYNFDTDMDELPPLELAVQRWAEAGYPIPPVTAAEAMS